MTFRAWVLVVDTAIIAGFAATAIIGDSRLASVLLGMTLMTAAKDLGRWQKERREL